MLSLGGILMRNRMYTLKTAVILPVVIIFVIILLIFVALNRVDNDFLAKEQGSTLVAAINENIEDKLSNLLLDARRANTFYVDYLSRSNSFNALSSEEVSDYTLEVTKMIVDEFPQITVVSYGDILNRYIGVRINDDATYSLMLQDHRTDDKLKIFEGETIDTTELAVIEGYDPTIRPWYAPAAESMQQEWSKIYVNYDEKMELTISTSMPIINEGEFIGIGSLDVKLDMINEFLIGEKHKGSGIIYVIDDHHNIIAHSLEEEYVKVIPGDPPTAELVVDYYHENPLVSTMAEYIHNNNVNDAEAFQHTIDGNKYFGYVSTLKTPEKLEWKVIVILNENDIMGEVNKRQNITIVIIIGIIIIGILVSMWVLSLVTGPIMESAKKAKQLSEGEWGEQIDKPTLPLYEVHELTEAMNSMSFQLESVFDETKSSEKKYRTLVENSDDMIYSFAPNGTVFAMNTRFESVLRVQKNEYVGKDFYTIFDREGSLKLWKTQIDKVLSLKEKVSFLFEYIDPDDKACIMNVKLIPQIDNEGNIVRIIGSNTDLTELVTARERLEELLQEENIKLEALVQERTEELNLTMKELVKRERLASLGSLVAGISHEVNTPLGVAVSATSYIIESNVKFIQKINEGKLSKEALAAYIERIEESSSIIRTNLERAAHLINSFKKISVDQSTEDIVAFNVKEYIESILLTLKHEYKHTQHKFEIHCSKDINIESYPGAFSQVFTNLIMNSLIHGFKGVEQGKILINVHINEEILEIIYSDSGVGIDKNHLEHIFDPFFTTNRTQGGSGLGMNIVYNLVTDKLNGTIECDSIVDEGTTFSIRIPYEKRS